MKKLIIGVSGKIGSGKSTTAEMIAEIAFKMNYNCTHQHCFADKLRECVELLTEVKMTEDNSLPFANHVRNYTQEQKNILVPEWGMTIGHMLQIMGTECMRDNFHKDTWVLSCMTRVKNSIADVIVIPDVRFINEANAIKEAGGILIRLEGDPAGVRANSTRDLNHQSEIELDEYDKFDYVIQNKFGLSELELSLTAILSAESMK